MIDSAIQDRQCHGFAGNIDSRLRRKVEILGRQFIDYNSEKSLKFGFQYVSERGIEKARFWERMNVFLGAVP